MLTNFDIANMSFNAIRENKILPKISEFKVYQPEVRSPDTPGVTSNPSSSEVSSLADRLQASIEAPRRQATDKGGGGKRSGLSHDRQGHG